MDQDPYNAAVRQRLARLSHGVNRLSSISSVPSSPPAGPAPAAVSIAYEYNSANQRTTRTEADLSYWVYSYDALGQVTSGRKHWDGPNQVAGQQFEYTFDNIGNRMSTKAGGNQSGAGLRTANYSSDLLNRYSARDVPGAFDVTGIAFGTNSVTVNGQTAERHVEYFRKEISTNNASNPVWAVVNVAAGGQTSVSGNVFVPKTQEQFGYDLDGNLTSDGQWNYAWDGENRLIAIAARTAVGPQISLRFEYDAKGRRIRKQVWSNATWTGSPTNEVLFAYHGWNLVAVLGSPSSVVQSFLWGSDLSGSLQGAGGVGGLIAVNDAASGVHFAAFDGNGNLAGLVKASDGTISARYEYGPFGEAIRATGPMATANKLRFSTKYHDSADDLIYYGYRYYSASAGRWLSRDPRQETTGRNLHSFVNNGATTAVDKLGLSVLRVVFTLDDSVQDRAAVTRAIVHSILRLQLYLMGPCCRSYCVGCNISASGKISQTILHRPEPDGWYPANWPLPGGWAEPQVIVTAFGIGYTPGLWPGFPGDTVQGKGIYMQLPYENPRAPDILSHELGHLAGYVGNAPPQNIHSTEPANLMTGEIEEDTPEYPFHAKRPDKQWCEKVAALAR